MADVKIVVRANGPGLVSGPTDLTDQDGNAFMHPDGVGACRCGGSDNKPFCDGAHSRKFRFDPPPPTKAQ